MKIIWYTVKVWVPTILFCLGVLDFCLGRYSSSTCLILMAIYAEMPHRTK